MGAWLGAAAPLTTKAALLVALAVERQHMVHLSELVWWTWLVLVFMAEVDGIVIILSTALASVSLQVTYGISSLLLSQVIRLALHLCDIRDILTSIRVNTYIYLLQGVLLHLMM